MIEQLLGVDGKTVPVKRTESPVPFRDLAYREGHLHYVCEPAPFWSPQNHLAVTRRYFMERRDSAGYWWIVELKGHP